jgi:hypothetical protein
MQTIAELKGRLSEKNLLTSFQMLNVRGGNGNPGTPTPGTPTPGTTGTPGTPTPGNTGTTGTTGSTGNEMSEDDKRRERPGGGISNH